MPLEDDSNILLIKIDGETLSLKGGIFFLQNPLESGYGLQH